MHENPHTERRKYTRFNVCDCSFALQGMYGPVIDISLDGLSFLYMQPERKLTEVAGYGMLFSGSTLCCERVPVHRISEQGTGNIELPLLRGGLQFGELSQEQYTRLESFIIRGHAGSLDMKPTYEELAAKLNKLECEIADFRQIDESADILLICSYCKKIKDDKGAWQKIETFVYDQYGVKLSHGICPECSTKYYPNLFNK